MSVSSETADQVVRMSIEGTEVALRITGQGAEKIARIVKKLLKSSMSQENKTKGEIRLSNLIKSGKRLIVENIPDGDLKEFCTFATKYGMLYSIVKDRNDSTGTTDILCRFEDRETAEHIMAKISNRKPKDKEPPEKDKTGTSGNRISVRDALSGETGTGKDQNSFDEHDMSDSEFFDLVVNKEYEKTVPKELVHTANPLQARAEEYPSVRTSDHTAKAQSSTTITSTPSQRVSVRAELLRLERERQMREQIESDLRRKIKRKRKSNEIEIGG